MIKKNKDIKKKFCFRFLKQYFCFFLKHLWSVFQKLLLIRIYFPLAIKHLKTEFPAVLLNLQSRVIEADFHTFVRPTEQPKLSEFCKNYTGISQDDVDNAPTLNEVIRMFHDWINSFRMSKGIALIDDTKRKQNTAFITWTDFDLGIYLPTESARKKIKLPPYFSKWIDLRDYYTVRIQFYT